MAGVTPPQDAFKTHSNYIRAFARLAVRPNVGGSLEPLRLRYKATPLVAGACSDPAAVFRSLRLAWSTELLMNVSAQSFEDDDVVRVANNWAVVQLYYVCYHATQALAQAKGFPRTASHSSTRRMFRNLWADRRIDLAPWGLARAGNEIRNWPRERELEDVHVWSNCDDDSCWLLAAKALRTTREEDIGRAQGALREAIRKERKKTWTREEAQRLEAGKKPRKPALIGHPQLTLEQKQQIEDRTDATTLIDYLYRLRIRANYQDSSMFTEGPAAEGEAGQVRDSLCLLASATLLVHELATADILGADVVTSEVDRFLSAGGSGIASRLYHRRAQVLAHRS